MSDEDLRQAERVAERHGYKLVEEVEFRHNPRMWNIRTDEPSAEIENRFRQFSETLTIPTLELQEGDTLQLRAPTGGAMARMILNGFSVYLDAYNALGFASNGDGTDAYWEMYVGGEHDAVRYNLDSAQEMLEDSRRFRDAR